MFVAVVLLLLAVEQMNACMCSIDHLEQAIRLYCILYIHTCTHKYKMYMMQLMSGQSDMSLLV